MNLTAARALCQPDPGADSQDGGHGVTVHYLREILGQALDEIDRLTKAATKPARQRHGIYGPIEGCSCTYEEGDSDCAVHPTCGECGAEYTGRLRTEYDLATAAAHERIPPWFEPILALAPANAEEPALARRFYDLAARVERAPLDLEAARKRPIVEITALDYVNALDEIDLLRRYARALTAYRKHVEDGRHAHR